MSIIQTNRISLDQVKTNPELFNSYNHKEFLPDDMDHDQYIMKFSFENWYTTLIEAELISISDETRKRLESISTIRVITGREINKNDIEELSPKFLFDIKQGLSKFNNGVFVKTSEKSAKNDHDMKPLYTVNKVLSEITGSKEILKYSMGKKGYCKYLVLKNWEPNIKESNEFRVIIENNRILGISQQKWYLRVGLTDALCLKIAKRIINWYNQIELPFNSAVLDVWVSGTNFKVHLIECNPGYCWGGSGSSLFHWINDREILDSDIIEIRYVE